MRALGRSLAGDPPGGMTAGTTPSRNNLLLALSATMRDSVRRRTSSVRQILLGSLALAMILLPGPVFSIVAATPWEVDLLRALALVGISLLAAVPWATGATPEIQRRMRRWSTPGVVASAVYLISADPIYLVLGLCLLSGATLDVWAARAHIASESLRTRLQATNGTRRG